MRRPLFLLATLLLLLPVAPARADLEIDVDNLTLAPGGTGFVDVFIRSTTGSDVLDIFGAEFRITTASGRRLEFVSPASDTQLTAPYNTNYVFPIADSAAILAGPPSGSISNNPNINDTYIGGDGTLSASGVTVPATNKLVLVRLEVTAATGNAPIVGDTFTISLVNSASTFFQDELGGDVAHSSTSGTVTIASVVPAPASLILGAIGGVGLLAYRLRRRQTAAQPPAQS